jgi:hypothetical protein
MADQPTTTEVTITGDNATLAAILQNRYGRLESGETRAALEEAYERVWNAAEFDTQFAAERFDPPYVHVIDKQSGQHGTVLYLDSPRFYFLFNAEEPHERRVSS